MGYPSGLAGPTDTQDRGRKPSLSLPESDYYPPTTHSTPALSGSGVPGSGCVGTPAAIAAAGEGPSPAAQQLHSLQPHATVRDFTLQPAAKCKVTLSKRDMNSSGAYRSYVFFWVRTHPLFQELSTDRHWTHPLFEMNCLLLRLHPT